ncbi:hypothetical protein B0H11DRAFT_1989927 [Mycena galericulata]|nr:hypothetical protein B0H11DRAFT_1989927 [Mycena galericulata]
MSSNNADRRRSLPLSFLYTRRVVLSDTNSASPSAEEPQEKLRKLPSGSENLNPSTPAASLRYPSATHARCSSASSALMTPTIKRVAGWFGAGLPRNEDHGCNDAVTMGQNLNPAPEGAAESKTENTLLASASLNFDVSRAAEQCKHLNGYVSFCEVAGLGAPPATPPHSRRS